MSESDEYEFPHAQTSMADIRARANQRIMQENYDNLEYAQRQQAMKKARAKDRWNAQLALNRSNIRHALMLRRVREAEAREAERERAERAAHNRRRRENQLRGAREKGRDPAL